MNRIIIWWLLLIIGGVIAVTPEPAESASAVPQAALKYQRDLTRNARAVWGIAAPIATFAAQVHQESGWRTDARSPYASGLAQFTPATAEEISRRHAEQLGANQPLNPSWALRALVTYDRELWERVGRFDSECDRMAFALAGYNGGEGWRRKRQARSPQPGSFAITGRINPGIRPENQRENEDYPIRILVRWQPVYAAWGPGVDCARLT